MCIFFFQTQTRFAHRKHLSYYMYADFVKKSLVNSLIVNERATLKHRQRWNMITRFRKYVCLLSNNDIDNAAKFV